MPKSDVRPRPAANGAQRTFSFEEFIEGAGAGSAGQARGNLQQRIAAKAAPANDPEPAGDVRTSLHMKGVAAAEQLRQTVEGKKEPIFSFDEFIEHASAADILAGQSGPPPGLPGGDQLPGPPALPPMAGADSSPAPDVLRRHLLLRHSRRLEAPKPNNPPLFRQRDTNEST